MKSVFLSAVLCMAVLSNIYARQIAPSVVVKSFTQKFPGAVNVHWEKEGKNAYEAGFMYNGKKASANFSATGSWLETEMELLPTDLIRPVRDGFARAFPDAVMTAAYKVEPAKGSYYFEIEYSLKGKKKEAICSPEGKIK